MASVYYLLDDASRTAEHIVQKYFELEKYSRTNHFAALTIQSVYRKYVARKWYKNTYRAIVNMQKYIRGWLIRYHLPDTMHEYYERICLLKYHKMATNIQSVWRGYLIRKKLDIREMIRIKRKLEGTDRNFLEEEENEEEKYCKEKVLQMLFDRHHLLSTEVQKGILQQNNELIEIEKILAAFKWTDYMNNRRKIYNKFYKKEINSEPHYHYIFSNKRMRHQEDLLRLKDPSNEKKEPQLISIDSAVEIKKSSFNLTARIDQYLYEPDSLLQPSNKIEHVTNVFEINREKHFILTLKKLIKGNNVPPYYGDFWYKECVGHNQIN